MSPDAPDFSDDSPAHIAIVDGTATIERDGRVETAEENIILLAGDRLRTERGRVEVLFADGSALDLDRLHTAGFAVGLPRASPRRPSFVSRSPRTTTVLDYRVDARQDRVWIKTAGDYRIALTDTRSGDQELGVTVIRGIGRAAQSARPHARCGPARMRRSRQARRRRCRMVANSRLVGRVRSVGRRSARRRGYGVESARYLPEEVRYYGGAFDRYGSWDYEPTYGHVWYPRVNVGWRPYHHGPLVVRRAVRLDLGGVRSSLGAGRRTTTAAGDMDRTGGSGFRDTAGRRRGSRGPTHRAT